jgi:hypothetical protein
MCYDDGMALVEARMVYWDGNLMQGQFYGFSFVFCGSDIPLVTFQYHFLLKLQCVTIYIYSQLHSSSQTSPTNACDRCILDPKTLSTRPGCPR